MSAASSALKDIQAAASLPPGPRAPPFLQTLRWIYRPVEYMEACRRRFGPTFTIRLTGSPPFVFVSEPELVKELLTGDADQLHAGEINSILKPVVGASSVLLLDGDTHLRQRKLMLPAFHGERMQAYASVVAEVTDRAIATWPVGEAFALHTEMQAITLDVILRAVIGLEDGEEYQHLRSLMRRMLDYGVRPIFLAFVRGSGEPRALWLHRLLGRVSPWMQFLRLRDQVDEVLFAAIKRRRALAGAPGNDVLSLLMQARDEGGAAMTDGELRDEMLTLLVAGHETTATALTWAVHLLLSHPEVRERLRDDASGEYVDAVCKETLRLRPVLPLIGRVLKAPRRIGEWELPAGVAVTPCIYLAHRRAETWPEPEVFRPERFMGTRVNPYTWFPFGGGVRRCLGMAFALYEMKVVLPRVMAVALRQAPGYRPRMVRRFITFALSCGLPVIRDS